MAIKVKNFLVYLVLFLNILCFVLVAQGVLVPVLGNLDLSSIQRGDGLGQGFFSNSSWHQLIREMGMVVGLSICLCIIDAGILWHQGEHNLFLFFWAILCYPVYLLFRNRVTDDTAKPFLLWLIAFLLFVGYGGFFVYKMDNVLARDFTEEELDAAVYWAEHTTYPGTKNLTVEDVICFDLIEGIYTGKHRDYRDDYLIVTGVRSSGGAFYEIHYNIERNELMGILKNGFRISKQEEKAYIDSNIKYLSSGEVIRYESD